MKVGLQAMLPCPMKKLGSQFKEERFFSNYKRKIHVRYVFIGISKEGC